MFSGPMSAGSQLGLVPEDSGGSLENRREGEGRVFLSLSVLGDMSGSCCLFSLAPALTGNLP